MYLKINNEQYTVSRRIVTPDTIKYLSVTPKPENISGTIQMFRDDGFLLSEDSADSFLRNEYIGTVLKLTNVPVPTPPQPQPDTRTAAQKRQEAYEKGYVSGEHRGDYGDWYVEWNEKRYTCDELSQLGMRYAFRGEAVAEEIRALVEAKVGEIRAAYPDENVEEGGE